MGFTNKLKSKLIMSSWLLLNRIVFSFLANIPSLIIIIMYTLPFCDNQLPLLLAQLVLLLANFLWSPHVAGIPINQVTFNKFMKPLTIARADFGHAKCLYYYHRIEEIKSSCNLQMHINGGRRFKQTSKTMSIVRRPTFTKAAQLVFSAI